ncbi:MAG: ClpXP protease specificity-enhancing factor [Halofilum sp. (in: g-proteobacteria)]
MTSSRPYLLRAIYQWIVDNHCTPYLLVNAAAPDVSVPVEYVENDKIILNIGPSAAYQLVLGDEEVTFNARFGGQPMDVSAPIAAVLAVYSRENGQGMLFTDDAEGETGAEPDADAGEAPSEPTAEPERGRPNLKVIK